MKKLISADLKLIKVIDTLRHYPEKYEDFIEVLADYKDDIINKVEGKCNKIIDQIQEQIIDLFIQDDFGFEEHRVYFYKMKADFQRYICQVANFNQETKISSC